MMNENYVCLDLETSTLNKGSPYDKDNTVVLWGFGSDNDYQISTDSIGSLYGPKTLVGFNLKFDLGWCKRYGIDVDACTIWDCQLAHFLLTGQSTPYPSLNGVAESLGLGQKIDKIKEYWDAGIDTKDIPRDELIEYLEQDLRLTEQVYLRQREAFKKQPLLYELFKLQCEDLLTLLDMEWNGIVVDVQGCAKKEKETEEEIKNLESQIREIIGDSPLNLSSNDHRSCLFYGGTLVTEVRVPVGEYKTGLKAGQTRYKIVEYKYEFPRLVDPPKGSELKKEGYYSTDEDTLRNLKGGAKVKRLVDLLLARSGLEKLRGTYLVGIPKQLLQSNSFDGRLHGQFAQAVTRTGRLSSSSPNLQNINPEMKKLLPSRYDE